MSALPIDNPHHAIDPHHLEVRIAGIISAGVEVLGGNPVSAVCVFCASPSTDIVCRRLNTAYADEPSNWITSCRSCWEDAVEHYRELWAEYYNGLGV